MNNLSNYKKITIIVTLCLLCACIAKPNPNDIFAHLDLDYSGLESVKNAYQIGDLPKAQFELLKYFNNRTNRSLLEPDKIYHFDSLKVVQNASNQFQLKGSYYDFGDKINWTKEHADMHWQLSLCRMGWFEEFIGIYQHTKDEKYVHSWMNQIESWLELDDPGYPRTIDTGRRMENWVKSHWMFVTKLKSLSVTPEFNAQMLASMAEQAEFLYNPDNWRRYSNWGSFENSGFSKFVIMFPEFKRNRMWLREIYFRMHSQLDESFYDEGMHIEVCPSYHGHELKVWLDFLKLAKLNKVKNPWHTQIPLRPLEELFIPPARALMHYYKPTGNMPQVGDTDLRDEREILSELAKFWDLPDLEYVASDGQLGDPPSDVSVAYPEVGYFIMRSGWGNQSLPFDKELYLLFDCGSNYPWHGHFDILNLVVTAYGYDLLKDAGRYTYNEGSERDYFKSTAAHNTIVVDKKDQPKKYTPPPAHWYSSPNCDYVVGVNDCNSEISHTRSVLFVKPEYWIVIDRLTGKGEHNFDQYWHLSEQSLGQVELSESGRIVTAPHLKLISLGNIPDVSLEQNYLSFNYREKVLAPVIRYSMQGAVPVVWPTVLFPYESNSSDVNVTSISVAELQQNSQLSNPVAIRVISNDTKDFFFEQEQSGTQCQFANFETDAKAALISVNVQDEIIASCIIGGSYLKYKGKNIDISSE